MAFPEKYIDGRLNPDYVTELEDRYTYTQNAIQLLNDMVESSDIDPSNGAIVSINSIRRKVSDPLPEEPQHTQVKKPAPKLNTL